MFRPAELRGHRTFGSPIGPASIRVARLIATGLPEIVQATTPGLLDVQAASVLCPIDAQVDLMQAAPPADLLPMVAGDPRSAGVAVGLVAAALAMAAAGQ